MAFIKNIRRGFATNSSSSHSFVYMKEKQTSAGDYDPGHYGWGDFRLNTVFEKVLYVATTRLGSYWDSEKTFDEIWEENKDVYPELSKEDLLEAYNGTVDHQSAGLIGLEEARNPYLVVFGGNDNSDGSQMRLAAEDEIDWLATPIGMAEVFAGREQAIKEKVKAFMRDAVAMAAEPVKQNKKVHLTASGDLRTCNATKRKCPYGEEDHFTDRASGEAALKERYGDN